MAENTAENSTVKEIEVAGVKFTVDTDRLDDVESLEFIERIENKGQVAAVLPLLKFIMGDKAFEELKAAFIKQDAEEHKDVEGYQPRMRMGKLNDVYMAIIEKFDPKG
jgi:hypothetical protein